MRHIFFGTFLSLIFALSVSAGNGPEITCTGLPGCGNNASNYSITIVGNVISKLIEYVAVIAVIALMIAGIMYLLSGGEEEKVGKAKKAIIWSLVGVVLSISALTIIRLVNNLSITGA